jgi:AcrR family transcriptional regulator
MTANERAYPSVFVRPRREPRSSLTREQIVAEALRLLDAEGVDALSMRKLAAGLGVGATSLYWHVANRDELIDLVIDKVYGELDLPGADEARGGADDWREAARRLAHSIRATTLRHPWVVSMLDRLVGATFLGPNLATATERMFALFEGAGFELREAERALNTMISYVFGVAIAEAAWHNWLVRHGKTAREWLDESRRSIDTPTTEGLERLRAVITAYEGSDPEAISNEDFEYGLERVLDGLQARLGSSS